MTVDGDATYESVGLGYQIGLASNLRVGASCDACMMNLMMERVFIKERYGSLRRGEKAAVNSRGYLHENFTD